METRTYPLCRTATPRRRPRLGGADRRQPTWPLAAQQQPRAYHRVAKRLPRLARIVFPRTQPWRLIHRTAVYGPVCTVVWEGRSREAPPYPDWGAFAVRDFALSSRAAPCFIEGVVDRGV